MLFAQHAALAIHNAQLHRQVDQLSVTDPLTGLSNRRRFDRELADELTRARRYAKPLALILCDLDLFKAVNDRFGHPAGDAALRAMGEVLRQTVRETDLPARVGGEEFAVLMPETGPDEALEVAERLRSGVENQAVEWEGQTFRLTISVGVAGSAGETLPDAPDELYRLADKATYRAKEAGRNRVVAAVFTEIHAQAES
jgi:diguanylate cyclase (GGDEF)-like protein